ncbi:uncharacterized protein LOC108672790 [Hyalella azteca]|uniref:Uncharacterized protein LOC108672790 n=1 Tax=Hyalella azteca TaxID=294128 RepID=A0A8B7NQP7_HYAAZ|nr:uncharacterized protein LOC108672790 [Hyalella azteca]
MSFVYHKKRYHPVKLTTEYHSKDQSSNYDTILLPLDEAQTPACCCVRQRNSWLRQLRAGRPWVCDARTAALLAAFFTMVCSVFVASMYCCLLYQLSYVRKDLAELYYGVQISYLAVLSTQLSLFSLSVLLYTAVLQERIGWVGLWMVGVVALTPLEGVCTMYSNILRDHVNKKFDVQSKVEMGVFIIRLIANVLGVGGVFRFYRSLQSGQSYLPSDQFSL